MDIGLGKLLLSRARTRIGRLREVGAVRCGKLVVSQRMQSLKVCYVDGGDRNSGATLDFCDSLPDRSILGDSISVSV